MVPLMLKCGCLQSSPCLLVGRVFPLVLLPSPVLFILLIQVCVTCSGTSATGRVIKTGGVFHRVRAPWEHPRMFNPSDPSALLTNPRVLAALI